MSPWLRNVVHSEDGFPRVSGDEPVHQGEQALRQAFSPRERG